MNMDRPGEFELNDPPSEYRHPSGVLVKFGEGLDEEGCHHWRSLHNVANAELNVVLTRRTASGELMTVDCCMVEVDTIEGWIEVCGYHDDDWTVRLPEVTRVALADVMSLEVL